MAKKLHPGFNSVLKALPQPKTLTLDTQLPHYFDVMWDAKTVDQLYLVPNVTDRFPVEVIRLLAEHGYDVRPEALEVLDKAMAERRNPTYPYASNKFGPEAYAAWADEQAQLERDNSIEPGM